MATFRTWIAADSVTAGLRAIVAVLATTLLIRRGTGQFIGPLPLSWALGWVVVTACAVQWPSIRRVLTTGVVPREALAVDELCGASLLLFSTVVITTAMRPEDAGMLLGGVMIALGSRIVLANLPQVAAVSQAGVTSPPLETSRAEEPARSDVGSPGEFAAHVEDEVSDDPCGDREIDDATSQIYVRRQESAGETIRGTVRMEFLPGQRDCAVHVVFSPPLSQLPMIDLEDPWETGWELKVTASFPFGLRLLARRRETHRPASGMIQFIARADTRSRAA